MKRWLEIVISLVIFAVVMVVFWFSFQALMKHDLNKTTAAPTQDLIATQSAMIATQSAMINTMIEESISRLEKERSTLKITPIPVETKIAETLAATLEPLEVSTSKPVQEKTGKLFQTPVKCEKSFNPESAWLVCEPGVLLDNTTAWTIPSVDATHYLNDPEGGFAYLSAGQGNLNIDGYTIDLPYIEGHNYLVLLRGRIDDGKIDTDRNVTVEVTKFKPGHASWSWMPKGAYVSMDWFLQQLTASTTEGFTDCGGLGCSHDTVVLFDTDTKFEQRFAVKAGDLLNWTPIENW